MNPEDIELEQTESTLLQVRRQLFSARQRNDQEAVDELEKQFDEIRKERARLLRVTWQM
jgi:ribosomal protein L29